MSHEDQIKIVKYYDVILELCFAQNMGGGKYKSNLPDNLEIIKKVSYKNVMVDTDIVQIKNHSTQAIHAGALAGGNFPTSNLGVIFRGLADNAYEAHKDLHAIDSFNKGMKIFIYAVIFSLILIAVFRFCFPSNWHIGKGVTFRKPEPFDKKQRQTFTLMIIIGTLL